MLDTMRGLSLAGRILQAAIHLRVFAQDSASSQA